MKKVSPKLHFRRIELKYVVPTKVIDLVVPTITKYLKPDTYANEDGFYTVNSLYYDSPRLICYQQKLDGVLFRKKYRIRFYGHKKEHFFEIKRKVGDTVIKERALIPNDVDAGYGLLAGNTLINSLPDNRFRAELTADYHSLHLKPKVLISYRRKPFVSRFSNNLRVTIDYDLKAIKPRNGELNKQQPTNYISPELAVFELKFNARLPAWLEHIIKTHNLQRVSFSKYASAIEKIVVNS